MIKYILLLTILVSGCRHKDPLIGINYVKIPETNSGHWVTCISPCIDTLRTIKKEYIICEFFDTTGTFSIQGFSNDTLLFRGNYISSGKQEILKITFSGYTKDSLGYARFFIPLKDGEWEYYNKETGKIKEKVFYSKGKIIN